MNNKYWWVNHKKTFKQEISGGYIWSPKKNKNNSRNRTYENLEKCLPGDIIYSYAFTKISCIGIIESKASTSFKPKEFGNTGQNWDREGWLVKVNWQPLKNPFHPKEVFEQIKDHLPETHSPLNKLGNGSEGCYLGDINQTLGEMLMKFIKELNNNVEIDMSFLEDEIERTKAYLEDIKACEKIENITEKEALIKARLGHGQFRRDVEILEPICRVTGLDKKEFLMSSSFWTIFMPLPPPPADAFIKTGSPISRISFFAVVISLTIPFEPGTSGNPIFLAIFFAFILSPISLKC